MAAPSYTYYSETYGGTLSQTDYYASLNDAVAHVDWLIGWKVVPAEYEDAYNRAVCSCVDIFHEYGRSAFGGFSIGSFRMGQEGGSLSGNDLATEAAWEILAPTGLLWSGIC